MKKCRICDNDTENIFNIEFKATPICENCATSLFLQQAKWYTENKGQNLPLHNVSKRDCPRCDKKKLEQDKDMCIDCWQKYENI